jgi:hypothetical protein
MQIIRVKRPQDAAERLLEMEESEVRELDRQTYLQPATRTFTVFDVNGEEVLLEPDKLERLQWPAS